ncbi:MAG: (2Fe-2S)-binding protein [Magnetovibrio sp.]|nr:(2Fe-2S)-binding protein [Magnetovibrio sp.]
MKTLLCNLSEIPNQDSQGFSKCFRGRQAGIMAIRFEKNIFTYRNKCPHIGSPLDFKPGKFLNADKTYIICSTHGALFRIQDGTCVSGPCTGAALTVVPNIVENDKIYLIESYGN